MLRFLFRTSAHCPAAEPQAERDWVSDVFDRFSAREGLAPASLDAIGRWSPEALFEVLDRARRAQGISLAEMARRAGCDGTQMHNMRRGKSPRIEVVAALADAAGMRLQLITPAGPARPAPTHRKEDPRC